MSDIETLSAEDKAYFDTRGETVTPPPADEPKDPVVDEPVDDDIGDTTDVETTEEPAGETDPADPDKATGQTKVPLAALTKERNERRAVAARLAETERKAAILEDRWTQLLARETEPAKPQAEAPPKLDLSADPMLVVGELLNDFEQRKQTAADQERQTKEQTAASEAWDKTLNVAKSQYEAAASTDETFEPTYTALRQTIGTEYMDLYGLTHEQAIAEVDRFEADQIAYAVDRGIDIATHMRKLAKARNVTVAPKVVPPNGEDLEKLAEGVSGSTSLSSAGGGRVVATSAQAIADMSPDDFAAWLGKDGNQAKFRKLAGG